MLDVRFLTSRCTTQVLQMLNPQIQLVELSRLFPDFKLKWDDPENYFKEDDGSFTVCGVFAEFSHHVRRQFDEMSEETKWSLFRYIENCISGKTMDDLSNAVCTCFLENLAGENFSARLRSYMGRRSLEYFKQWDNVEGEGET